MTEKSKSPASLRPIGTVRTPYEDWAPNQPLEREAEPGTFRIEVDPRYEAGLAQLGKK